MSKYNKLYDILHCDIDIPNNDLAAWKKYPQFNWIYNKLDLALFQNIKAAPMPIKPSKLDCDFPVILKPIINLYGMGLNSKKINNLDEFFDHWHSNHFWMEFFEGVHKSWDFILLNGQILFFLCFKGYADNKRLGRFWYWESFNSDDIKKWNVFHNCNNNGIPNIIIKLILEKFNNYSGCLNIETIDNKIIECHLRMGDLDLFPNLDLFRGIIQVYKNKPYSFHNNLIPKLFFIPMWIKKDAPSSIFSYVQDNMISSISSLPFVIDAEVDDPTLGGPGDFKRLLWISTHDFAQGKSFLRSLKKDLLCHFDIYISVI